MYIFGEFVEQEMTGELASIIINTALAKRGEQANKPIDKIITVLNKVAALWKPGTIFYQKAQDIFAREEQLPSELVIASLAIIPELLQIQNLRQRINAEFGQTNILDTFSNVPYFTGSVRAFPLGVVLHVSAGNVFLGAIDTLVMGFLTKNINILKLSGRASAFPFLFAESIVKADIDGVISKSFCITPWKGGSEAIEAQFKDKVQGIIAWGGQEMLSAYQKHLAAGVKLIDFGPKISLQVITCDALQSVGYAKAGQQIAQDIALYDGQACASPQNCFIENSIDIKALMASTAQALDVFPIPRGTLSDDEFVEIHKEKARGQCSCLFKNGWEQTGLDYYLHFDTAPFLRASPQNRTLIFKQFSSIDNLASQLEPFSYHLQSCSYLAIGKKRSDIQNALGLIGIKRFTPLGRVMEGLTGAPHDGRYALRELVNFVGDEAPKVEAAVTNGYIFSSGGTSGAPKYSSYSYDEFQAAIAIVAQGYMAQGLRAGTTVANLFAAGNMWSSFLVTDKALALCNVVQLPIGGLSPIEDIVFYLNKFKPEAICGLPSLIISYARYAESINIPLNIPHIFYAGEHLNQAAREYLTSVWQTKTFYSAGYASVDAGPIGWQCKYCAEGEHHLIGKYVTLEIINEEAVVTSTLRATNSIVRYKTGDRVVLSSTDSECLCGSKDIKFTLLGRIDGIINIWACRLAVLDIEKSLVEANIAAPIYQIEIAAHTGQNAYFETLTLIIEGEAESLEKKEPFLRALLNNSKDLSIVHTASKLSEYVFLKYVPEGTIPRIARTGKIKTVVDKRQ